MNTPLHRGGSPPDSHPDSDAQHPADATPRPPGRRVARRVAVLAILLLGLAWAIGARAQPLEVPDPQAWAQLSPAEQAARRAEIAQRLKQAPPAERQAFRRALAERLQTLTPEQRQALAGQTLERWNQLSPQERERLQEERRARLQAMTPQERRQLLQQRRAILEKLTPEERARLREPLPLPTP